MQKEKLKEWHLKAPWGNIGMTSCGDVRSQPVFFVHGRQDCAATFLPLLKHVLPGDDFYYVALDMPGSGISDAFPVGVEELQTTQRDTIEENKYEATSLHAFEHLSLGIIPISPPEEHPQSLPDLFDEPIRCNDHGTRRCHFATRVPAFDVPPEGAITPLPTELMKTPSITKITAEAQWPTKFVSEMPTEVPVLNAPVSVSERRKQHRPLRWCSKLYGDLVMIRPEYIPILARMVPRKYHFKARRTYANLEVEKRNAAVQVYFEQIEYVLKRHQSENAQAHKNAKAQQKAQTQQNTQAYQNTKVHQNAQPLLKAQRHKSTQTHQNTLTQHKAQVPRNTQAQQKAQALQNAEAQQNAQAQLKAQRHKTTQSHQNTKTQQKAQVAQNAQAQQKAQAVQTADAQRNARVANNQAQKVSENVRIVAQNPSGASVCPFDDPSFKVECDHVPPGLMAFIHQYLKDGNILPDFGVNTFAFGSRPNLPTDAPPCVHKRPAPQLQACTHLAPLMSEKITSTPVQHPHSTQAPNHSVQSSYPQNVLQPIKTPVLHTPQHGHVQARKEESLSLCLSITTTITAITTSVFVNSQALNIQNLIRNQSQATARNTPSALGIYTTAVHTPQHGQLLARKEKSQCITTTITTSIFVNSQASNVQNPIGTPRQAPAMNLNPRKEEHIEVTAITTSPFDNTKSSIIQNPIGNRTKAPAGNIACPLHALENVKHQTSKENNGATAVTKSAFVNIRPSNIQNPIGIPKQALAVNLSPGKEDNKEATAITTSPFVNTKPSIIQNSIGNRSKAPAGNIACPLHALKNVKHQASKENNGATAVTKLPFVNAQTSNIQNPIGTPRQAPAVNLDPGKEENNEATAITTSPFVNTKSSIIQNPIGNRSEAAAGNVACPLHALQNVKHQASKENNGATAVTKSPFVNAQTSNIQDPIGTPRRAPAVNQNEAKIENNGARAVTKPAFVNIQTLNIQNPIGTGRQAPTVNQNEAKVENNGATAVTKSAFVSTQTLNLQNPIGTPRQAPAVNQNEGKVENNGATAVTKSPFINAQTSNIQNPTGTGRQASAVNQNEAKVENNGATAVTKSPFVNAQTSNIQNPIGTGRQAPTVNQNESKVENNGAIAVTKSPFVNAQTSNIQNPIGTGRQAPTVNQNEAKVENNGATAVTKSPFVNVQTSNIQNPIGTGRQAPAVNQNEAKVENNGAIAVTKSPFVNAQTSNIQNPIGTGRQAPTVNQNEAKVENNGATAVTKSAFVSTQTLNLQNPIGTPRQAPAVNQNEGKVENNGATAVTKSPFVNAQTSNIQNPIGTGRQAPAVNQNEAKVENNGATAVTKSPFVNAQTSNIQNPIGTGRQAPTVNQNEAKVENNGAIAVTKSPFVNAQTSNIQNPIGTGRQAPTVNQNEAKAENNGATAVTKSPFVNAQTSNIQNPIGTGRQAPAVNQNEVKVENNGAIAVTKSPFVNAQTSNIQNPIGTGRQAPTVNQNEGKVENSGATAVTKSPFVNAQTSNIQNPIGTGRQAPTVNQNEAKVENNGATAVTKSPFVNAQTSNIQNPIGTGRQAPTVNQNEAKVENNGATAVIKSPFVNAQTSNIQNPIGTGRQAPAVNQNEAKVENNGATAVTKSAFLSTQTLNVQNPIGTPRQAPAVNQKLARTENNGATAINTSSLKPDVLNINNPFGKYQSNVPAVKPTSLRERERMNIDLTYYENRKIPAVNSPVCVRNQAPIIQNSVGNYRAPAQKPAASLRINIGGSKILNASPEDVEYLQDTVPSPYNTADINAELTTEEIPAEIPTQPPRPSTMYASSSYCNEIQPPKAFTAATANFRNNQREPWTPFNYFNPLRPLNDSFDFGSGSSDEQNLSFMAFSPESQPYWVPEYGHVHFMPLQGVKIMRFHFLGAMEAAIEHLGWDKFIFIGHSMGCEIGLFFNTIYPGRITKMIFLDAEPTLRRLQVQDLAVYQPKFYDDYYNNYEKDNHYYRTYTIPQAKQALMRARNLTEEAASVIVSKSLIHVSGDQYRFTWDRRLRLPAPQNYPNTYYFALFKNIPPTLLITALESYNENSQYKAGSLELIAMLSTLKNFKEVKVEGNHDVHLNYPERVAPYVKEFLTKNIVLPSKL